MSAFYDAKADTALQLIKKRGRSIGIKREAETIDPVEGTTDGTPPASGTLTAVVLPASKGTIQAFDNRLKSDTLIDEKLRYILAAAKDAPFAPEGGDTLTFDGADWFVLGSTPLAPDGTPLIYKMGVKKL